MLFQIDIKLKGFEVDKARGLRVMLFQIDIKQPAHSLDNSKCLRVMLFQIDIKLVVKRLKTLLMFESNVILDRYKTLKNAVSL